MAKNSVTKKVSPVATIRSFFRRLNGRFRSFVSRRPHRSFRRTRRRDYARSLKLPGYIAFTAAVFAVIARSKKLLLGAALLYAAVMIAVVGLASQETYNELSNTITEASNQAAEGGIGAVGEAAVVLLGTVSGNLNGAVTAEAQTYAAITALFFWLIVVWLLRNILAERKVKIRDALYNSGAPFISTLLVCLVAVIQLVPVALAIIAYSAASGSGLLDGGVESMLIWLAIILLGVLSLYWVVSTLIALVVVTLPGMYPMQAIKTAGDLVVGRRLRIFLRFIWMIFITLIAWAVIMIPVILFDSWIKSVWTAIGWLPLVPFVVMILGSLTLLFSACYTYLLYRRIVDDDAKPA